MRQQGLTLLELIVTLGILTLLIALGLPSFLELIRANRLTSATNTLVAALNLTRSEAVTRGDFATLCASSNGASCSAGGAFDQGWIVFIDPDENAQVENNNQIVRVYEPLADGITAVGQGTVVNTITYRADGIVNGFRDGAIALCQDTQVRCIRIKASGRISLSSGCSCGFSGP